MGELVERMRAAGPAGRWAAHLRFPGIPARDASKAHRVLVGIFAQGWVAERVGDAPIDAAFSALVKKMTASAPDEESRAELAKPATIRGLAVAFYAGWAASAKLRGSS